MLIWQLLKKNNFSGLCFVKDEGLGMQLDLMLTLGLGLGQVFGSGLKLRLWLLWDVYYG